MENVPCPASRTADAEGPRAPGLTAWRKLALSQKFVKRIHHNDGAGAGRNLRAHCPAIMAVARREKPRGSAPTAEASCRAGLGPARPRRIVRAAAGRGRSAERLSIQVHPGDGAARALGHERGKDEAWYVVAAEPGAVIGVGLARAVSRD